jgi:hypothetical protein
MENLIREDGFDRTVDFWDCLNKQYDLSKPKRFAVYRWRWD